MTTAGIGMHAGTGRLSPSPSSGRRMLRGLLVSVVLLALAIPISVALLVSVPGINGRNGQLTVVFEPGPRELERIVRPAFARAEERLNRALEMPANLPVNVVGEKTEAEVGIAGAGYHPTRRAAYISWSFVTDSREHLKRLHGLGHLRQPVDRVLDGALTFVLYHEVAHGLIHLYDLPIVGDEEHAADGFASIFALAADPAGEPVALGGAALLDARAQVNGEPRLADYAARHGLDRGRAFDTVCLVHGTGAPRYQHLLRVAGQPLPPERARACTIEYRRQRRSWQRLLGPWLADERALVSR